jgi:hypothetical protein
MVMRNRNGQIILLSALLLVGCAKSSTRLARAEDGGDSPLDKDKRGANEIREDGALSSDADPEATEEDDAEVQTESAGSGNVERTGTGGIRIETGGGGEAALAGNGAAGTAVGGYGGSNEPPPPPDDDPSNIANTVPGRQILNPQECETDRPFVLGINPDGSSGFVEGWLESTPVVAFEGELPHFDPMEKEGILCLWWSINTVGPNAESKVYFYGTNDATSVAVAEDVEHLQEITDASSLVYDDWSTHSITIGTIVVFHHEPTDRYLALRLDDVYSGEAGDPEAREGMCAAINASWAFAPVGSADFSSVELPDDRLDNE